ncbi:MAG: YbaK/EbsC family protein [Tissierellia bacterium]|nr:YbaK/EbsC family protein [Tissierellia bacterium]
MSVDRARRHLEKWNFDSRVEEFEVSSATVALAAKALGTEEARIAKTISFDLGDRIILIVTAGDAKIDNRKFKDYFGVKARMLPRERVEEEIGYDVGGVCPFGVNPGVDIYLDESMKRFDVIFPAAGSASSCARLSPEELELAVPGSQWINVCKDWD